MTRHGDKARAYHRRTFRRIFKPAGGCVNRTVLKRYPDGHFDYSDIFTGERVAPVNVLTVRMPLRYSRST